MPRKGKYNKEIVKIICDAIATKGSDRDGYEAGKISYDTFYRWIKEKPEFSEAIAIARKEAIRNRPASLTRSAFEIAQELLVKGHIIRRTRTRQQGSIERKIYKIDDQGNKKLSRVEEEHFQPTTEIAIDEMGVPSWLVQRYLPELEPDLEKAIAVIRKHGLDVHIDNSELWQEYNQALADPSQENSHEQLGFSDEQAANILDKFLLNGANLDAIETVAENVEADASNASAVSSEVGERSIAGQNN